MTDRDRLIDIFKKIEYTPFPEMTIKASLGNQFTEYALNTIVDELLANGVIVPPCKVGAEIFGLFDNDDEQRKEIYDGKVLCYSLDENNLLWARMRYKNGLTYWHTIDDFGKTVFLTKEEAEAKLKELGK